MGSELRTVVAAALASALSACALPQGPTWTADTLFGVTSEARDYGDFLSARYAGMVGDAPSAAAYFHRAFDRSPHDPVALENATLAYLVSGNVSEAVALATRAHPVVAGNSPSVQLVLAIDEIASGKSAKAGKRLADVRFGTISAQAAHYLSAWIAGQDGVAAGLAVLDSQSSPRGRSDDSNLVRALILSSAGRTHDALDAVRAGPPLRTASPYQAALHASVLAATGDRDGALEILSTYEADTGPHAETGVLAEAIRAGQAIAAPRLSAAGGAAAVLHIAASGRNARLGSGVSVMRHAMSLYVDPGFDPGRLYLAEALRDQDRPDAAIDILNGMPGRSPFLPDAKLAMAWIQAETNQTDAALASVREAVLLTGRRDVLVGAGDVFRGIEQFADAEASYNAAVKADAATGRADWRLLFARAAARVELGRWEEAEADLVAALAVEPDRPELLNFLGYGWVDRGERVSEGLAMIQRAAAAMPNEGYIIDSLGWAYFRLGRYDEAVERLEQATELSPNDPVIVDHLGDAYWRAGREREAEFQWRRALSFSPDEVLAADISVKLTSGLAARTDQAAALVRSLP